MSNDSVLNRHWYAMWQCSIRYANDQTTWQPAVITEIGEVSFSVLLLPTFEYEHYKCIETERLRNVYNRARTTSGEGSVAFLTPFNLLKVPSDSGRPNNQVVSSHHISPSEFNNGSWPLIDPTLAWSLFNVVKVDQ